MSALAVAVGTVGVLLAALAFAATLRAVTDAAARDAARRDRDELRRRESLRVVLDEHTLPKPQAVKGAAPGSGRVPTTPPGSARRSLDEHTARQARFVAVHESGHRVPLDESGPYQPDRAGRWHVESEDVTP